MDRYEYLSAYAKMRHGCIYEENRGIGFFRAEQLKSMGGVEHGFTARQGRAAESVVLRKGFGTGLILLRGVNHGIRKVIVLHQGHNALFVVAVGFQVL